MMKFVYILPIVLVTAREHGVVTNLGSCACSHDGWAPRVPEHCSGHVPTCAASALSFSHVAKHAQAREDPRKFASLDSLFPLSVPIIRTPFVICFHAFQLIIAHSSFFALFLKHHQGFDFSGKWWSLAYSTSVPEYEKKFAELCNELEKKARQENAKAVVASARKWLLECHADKHKWVAAWTNCVFVANARTTNRVESFFGQLKKALHRPSSLVTVFQRVGEFGSLVTSRLAESLTPASAADRVYDPLLRQFHPVVKNTLNLMYMICILISLSFCM